MRRKRRRQSAEPITLLLIKMIIHTQCASRLNIKKTEHIHHFIEITTKDGNSISYITKAVWIIYVFYKQSTLS